VFALNKDVITLETGWGVFKIRIGRLTCDEAPHFPLNPRVSLHLLVKRSTGHTHTHR